MAALTGNKIKDSYLGLLKTTNSGILTSSFVRITDGGGNNTQLYLSNTAIRFYDAYTFPSADGTVSGQVLTTDANGALSWADSSDNQTLDEVLTQGNTTNLAILSTANGNTFGSTTFTGVATLANNSVVTGTPPTASDNSTKIATTAYVDNQVSTGGTVKKTGTITQNAIAVWNNTSDTLRSDFSVSVSTDGTITLYQPNNVPSDIKNYNIGGGNIALNTGGFNTGFGEGNLSQVGFLGSNNSAFGYESSFAMTTGDNNTSVGFSSLFNETVGDDNTAIGHYSLFYSNNGNYNTAIGSYSLYTNSSGGQNVALGYEALRNNTTSSHNAALGYRALKLSTGDHNLGVGYNSGSAIVTGNNNVVIGSNTGSTIDGLSNRIIISDGAANIRQLIDNLGKLQMPSYGSASPHTGTLAKTLAVDSSGYVIEVDATTGTVTSVALSVPTGLTVTNSPITTSGTITIGGTLGVANGGTGATTLTGILLGNGTSAISAVTDGTVGQVLSTDGSGTYSFANVATGNVTGAGVQYQVAVWDGTNSLTGNAAFQFVTGIQNSIKLIRGTGAGNIKFYAADGTTLHGYIENQVTGNGLTIGQLDGVTSAVIDLDDSTITFKTNSNPHLTISSTGAATFSSSVTAGNQLSILGGDGGGKILYFTGGTTKYNFMIAAQQNANNALEITPSTTAGGSTFSTPALTIASTGAATFSSTLGCSGAFIQLNQTELFASAGLSNRAWAFALGNENAGDLVLMQGSTALGGTYTPRVAITSDGVLQAKYGISFPNQSAGSGTVSSSVLDAYEEGTWTPSPNFSTTNAFSSLTSYGTYTRIGRLVTATLIMSFEKGSSAGNFTITGLPFAVINTTVGSGRSGFSVSYLQRIGQADKIFTAYATENTTTIQPYFTGQLSSATVISVAATDISTDTASVVGTITYQV